MIQLHNEDCYETLCRLQDASIDMILQDPPYGVTKNLAEVRDYGEQIFNLTTKL